MKTTCPHCETKVEVEEEEHYNEVVCPECDQSFQVFSDTTQTLTREFLDQVLKRDDAGE